MKEIKIEQLNLKYFKGAIDAHYDFADLVTSIYGDNETGKTTILDAFLWLFSGKDSTGKTDSPKGGFSIKTLNPDNTVILGVDHEVSAVLYVDGRRLPLRRILRENWVKRKGESKPVLDGNETVCYFDDIPVSIGEYNRRIGDIIGDKWFRLITDNRYFNSLSWKERREVLIKMAGELSMGDIIEMHPEFSDILALLDGASVKDFKAKIAALKTKVNDELKQIPTRIDQERQSIPDAVDEKAVIEEINTKQTRIDNIYTAMQDKISLTETKEKDILLMFAEIAALKEKQQNVINAAKSAESDRAFEAQKDKREIEQKLTAKRNQLADLVREIQSKEYAYQTDERALNEARTTYANLGNSWRTSNESTYNPSGKLICPVFGHECADLIALQKHEANDTEALQKFNTAKVEKLTQINESGQAVKVRVTQLETSCSTLVAQKGTINLEKEAHEKEIETLEAKIKEFPPYIETPIVPENLTLWIEYEKDIIVIQKKIDELRADVPDNTELLAEKTTLTDEIDLLKKQLFVNETRQTKLKEIERLTAEQMRLSQEISDLEAKEFRIDQYTKVYITEVENRVNGMFKYVKFKMFEIQMNGIEIECCDTLVKGVPYDSGLNNAACINAGLDIINVISEFIGIIAPVFIDNAESVTKLIPTKAQLIRLVVSELDYKLRTVKA